MAIEFAATSRRRTALLFGLGSLQAGAGLFALLGAWLPRTAEATPSELEHRLIEALIQRVAEHPTMKFVRNGKDHDAAVAAQHLRAKYKHFKSEIATADDFIRLCATRSESSGELYRVRLGSGPEQEAGVMMKAELARLRSGPG
ncbi:conserved hypothetical protein [Burkholderiales bacterium 8X]|nr:conserved hypothetical protein [Burkholderiales bacterium 8X]